MQVLVINLERSPVRRRAMRDALGALAIRFERIPAVDGRKLSASERSRWCSRPGLLGYRLGPGEIGCFLSHRLCWEHAAAAPDPFVTILEDDIDLTPEASQLLSTNDWIPDDADIVKLETRLRSRTLIDSKAVRVDSGHVATRLRSRHHGSAGYVIRREAAERLLARSQRFTDAVDQFLFNPRISGFNGLAVYQLVPAICIQHKWRERHRAGTHAPPSELDLERRARVPRRNLRDHCRRLGDKLGQAVARVYDRLFISSTTHWERIPFG